MKKVVFFSLLAIALLSSCTQKVKGPDKVSVIENTLMSVSFYSDSTGNDPADIVKSFEKVNKAIDSIGYPDAGYKIWHVQSDTTKNIRFMIQGSWPDQEVYNTIHENELYMNAIKELQSSASNLKQVFYNRFTLVK